MLVGLLLYLYSILFASALPFFLGLNCSVVCMYKGGYFCVVFATGVRLRQCPHRLRWTPMDSRCLIAVFCSSPWWEDL